MIAGAAVWFMNAMRTPDYSNSSVKSQNLVVINAQSLPPKAVPNVDMAAGISSCRATGLRMKNLKELQQLLESKILNEAEFTKQKAIVLESLRNLKQ